MAADHWVLSFWEYNIIIHVVMFSRTHYLFFNPWEDWPIITSYHIHFLLAKNRSAAQYPSKSGRGRKALAVCRPEIALPWCVPEFFRAFPETEELTVHLGKFDHDLTSRPKPVIMVFIGESSRNGRTFQVSELLWFTQIHVQLLCGLAFWCMKQVVKIWIIVKMNLILYYIMEVS